MRGRFTDKAQDFWTRRRAEIEKMIDEKIYFAMQNHRPRGIAGLPLIVGSTDNALVSSLNAQMHVECPFPINVDRVTLTANAPCNVTIDLWVQRCEQGTLEPIADAASIVNLNYPALIDEQQTIILPVVAPATGPGPVWGSLYINQNSFIYVYVLDSDGGTDILSINLSGRSIS